MASDFAKDLIKKHEGLRLKPYHDVMGFVTIGYGRNLDGKGISKVEANELFENDIIDAEVSLAKIFGLKILEESENRIAALLSMVFNLGEAGFSRFQRMIQAVKEKDWERAAIEAEDSYWFRQVPHRAADIIKLIREG